MKTKTLIWTAALAIACLATPVVAQGTTSPGASGQTPGHQMQDDGPKGANEPGASGYAPGHQTNKTGKESSSSTGASSETSGSK